MRLPLNLNPLVIAAFFAAAAITGCSDSTSTRAFGANGLAETGSGESEEEEEESGSEVSPPESFPEMGVKIVAFDNFDNESFTLDSESVVYILVQNPEQQQFDAWLMTDSELTDYRGAINSLPASAEETHQNYKAEYGLDLSDSMSTGNPINTDLDAGDYHIVIDNTDLGGNETFQTDEISYQYAIYAGQDLVLITED